MKQTGKCSICDKEGGTCYVGGPFPYLHKRCKEYAHRAIFWYSKYQATVWSIRPWVGKKKLLLTKKDNDDYMNVKEGEP